MMKNKLNPLRLFMIKNSLGFSRKKVGIQIGDSKLKVILLEREKNGQWDVKVEITEKLAEDVVSEGKILQPEILGFKIRETFINHNIKEKKVSVFIEELPFFVRQVKLPNVPKKELKETIQYKVQTELPVDVNDLIIQYSHLNSQIVDGKLEEEYTVVAVYRSLIEKGVQTFRQAGLAIESFGLEPEAIYKGLKYKKIIEQIDGSHLLVRKDSRRMMLAIYSKDKLMYSRYTPISYAYGQEDDNDEDEITRTVLSWNGKHSKDVIKAVVLLGEEESWQKTEQGIKAFMPFLAVETITSPFTACLGISLKNSSGDNLNIYLEKEKSQVIENRYLIYPLFGFLAFLLLFFLSNELQIRKDIASLKENIKQSSELVSLLSQREQLETEKNNLELIKSNAAENYIDIVPFINHIQKYQPASIVLSKIVYSKDIIMLDGTSNKQEDIVAFYEKLQEDSMHLNVHLKQTSNNNENILFTMDIQTNALLVSGD